MSVLYLQTLKELGKVHRLMKYFHLEGIDIFDFLAGFCHVEFPEYLTLLNKISNLPYARKVCFGSFLSRDMFTVLSIFYVEVQGLHYSVEEVDFLLTS